MERPDNEDKATWCELGRRAEIAFAGPVLDGLAIYANPAKARDKYTHDLCMVLPADLKTVRTRFNSAGRYGISPKYAITLNDKDVQRYRRLYPQILIVFDIDFGDWRSLRYAALREIQALIDAGHAQRHQYLHRINDNQGNAASSWVLDARWLEEIRHEQ